MAKTCYIDYIGMVFHQYVSLDVHQDDPSQEKGCYIVCISMDFHQCVSSDVNQGDLLVKRT